MILVGDAQQVAGAKLDYAVDFADVLGAATLSSAAWATISGLTNLGDSTAGATALVRYTSATVGAIYLANVAATLSTGEIVIAAFRLEIVTRIIVQDLTMAVGAVKILDELPWTPYLDGDTIASRSWSSSGAGLTITSGGTTATPKVTAVSAGTWYATEHIVTTSGQEDERSIAIVMRGLT